MSNLNIRNVPDDLHRRIRLAAAGGGERIPRGALEKFVIRALKRAVEDPQPGAGLPRIKLCAHCFQTNVEIATAPKIVPASNFDTSESVIEPRVVDRSGASAIFQHLLSDEDADRLRSAEFDFDVEADHMPPKPGEAAEPLSSQTAAFPEVQLSELGAIEVAPRLWVGSDAHYCPGLEELCSVVSAAKDPWHREIVGYETKSAPEGPERLVARRGNHLVLNLIDVEKLGPGGAHYVPDEVIEAALVFIHERLTAGDHVLVHCNQGRSRGPSIAFLYLRRFGPAEFSSPEALANFGRLYENFLPSAGMTEYLRQKLAH